MDDVRLSIECDGSVNKTKLLEIHNRIRDSLKCSNDSIGLNYGFYIVRAYPFLRLLRPVVPKNIVDIFKQNVAIRIKLPILMDYISIAREYIPITLQQKQNIVCPNCDKMMVVEKIEGELLCDHCGFIYDTRLPGIKDMESINTCRSYYSLKSNLLRAIYKFEGKQLAVDSADLELINKEIKKRKINTNSLKAEHIIKMLKDLKLTKYQDEVYSLLPLLTHKPRPSIQSYIPKILKLHDELEYAYTAVKNPSRVNSLNVHFKLYKLLKLCNKDFDMSDLCTLKTEQKFEEHEEKWREICGITGWTDS